MSRKITAPEPAPAKDSANPLWGGRFEAAASDILQAINASIDVDKRLYDEDIAGSKAHAEMLVATGIISAADGAAIQEGLETVRQEIASGRFAFDIGLEDIHMNIEARLAALIGAPAGRLHTARSRNDQVATDFRLWVRHALERTDLELKALQAALIERADEHADTIMPGFTHLQVAQPVTFGHHLLAYVEMLGRDRGRMTDCATRLNECPLGAGALAGTSFPIDRHRTAKALGFTGPTANSMDAISARDFALEALAAATIAATHLSRFAEEIVLWSSAQFGFIKLSDRFTTGSSMMPQKRNPDAAELVRGKSGRILGAFVALSATMKGLALTYSKDMQEDKPPLFDAFDALSLCVRASEGMVRDLVVSREAMALAAGSGHSTATDLADWLVRTLGLPFREAHHVTGRIVRAAEAKGIALAALSLDDMRAVEPRITAEVFDILTPARSASSRTSHGGTAPSEVRKQIARAKERFL
ncbi:MAG: argininosuccinate lyase [Alphaproteobacteria bacterium]|nr:argininosuccinate lyase [Alphaproteobacteria bacterium]